MTRKMRLCCTWSVLFFFLFTLLSPDDAISFDTDTLKTAGIISGITLGVALIVVLIVGSVRDMKRDRDEEEEDDDVWTQSPVLRTLGYRHADNPLLGILSDHPEGSEGRQEIEAFLRAKVDRVLFVNPCNHCAPASGSVGAGDLPPGFSLAFPAADRKGNPPPFSLYRSGRIDSETGRAPGTT